MCNNIKEPFSNAQKGKNAKSAVAGRAGGREVALSLSSFFARRPGGRRVSLTSPLPLSPHLAFFSFLLHFLLRIRLPNSPFSPKIPPSCLLRHLGPFMCHHPTNKTPPIFLYLCFYICIPLSLSDILPGERNR